MQMENPSTTDKRTVMSVWKYKYPVKHRTYFELIRSVAIILEPNQCLNLPIQVEFLL